MKISLIQTRGNCSSPENLKQLETLIHNAADQGAGLAVLPELVFYPYFPQQESPDQFSLAHKTEDPRVQHLRSLSRQYQMVLVVPFFEKQGRGIYFNSAAVFDADGSELGIYRKMHIPDDPGFYEKYYFSPGDLGFKVFDTRAGRVGVLICWDQWFPEAARLTALQGCDIIVCPTAIGWDRKELAKLAVPEQAALKQQQLESWMAVQRGHAIANGIFWAAVNRVGIEDNLDFWGSSFIYGPRGSIIGALDSTSESALTVSCSFDEIDLARNAWPFLRDRRIDAYDGLLKRYLESGRA